MTEDEYKKYDWKDKAVLDSFTERILIDLYATIAGITSGYLSRLQEEFGYSKDCAQHEIMMIDTSARNAVSYTYHIYDKRKEDEE